MIVATIPPQNILPEPVPMEYCVSCRDIEHNGKSIFKLLKEFSMTSPQALLKNRISEIDNLSDNWDGYGAVAPSRKVIKNSFKFIDCILDGKYYDALSHDDIVPTPYGSIVLDFRTSKGMVSVEVGKSEIGFFTEYVNAEELSSDGIRTDFRSIPDELRDALNKLYV